MNPDRYKLIPDAGVRQQLEQYDRKALDIVALERSMKDALEGNTYESYVYAHELRTKIAELRQKKSELGRALSRAKVRWCDDSEVYFVASGDRSSYPCSGRSLY